MISIDLATLVASVVITLLGNGLLGNYLLQRLRSQQDQALACLKAEQDTDVKRLQAALERTVFVHRVQFETEFAAMKAIWEKVMCNGHPENGLTRDELIDNVMFNLLGQRVLPLKLLSFQ